MAIVDINFNAMCTQCGTVVFTKTDQSRNKRFVCGKSCNATRSSSASSNALDKKFGPKVIPKYISYDNLANISCLFNKLVKNDVRCDTCHKRFFSDTIPDNCDDCIQNRIRVDSKCVSCNIKISGTPAKLLRKHNKCVDCFNMSEAEFVCEICNIRYTDTHNSFNALNHAYCSACRTSNKVKYILLHNYSNNENVNQILNINPNINIKITYNIEDIYSIEEDRDTVVYPFMNIFDITQNLFDNNDFMYFYNPPSDRYSYTIIDYEIINS